MLEGVADCLCGDYSPAALAQHAILFLGQRRYGDELALARGDTVVRLEARGPIRSHNSIALLQAAIAGDGIAVVPSFVAASPLAGGAIRRGETFDYRSAALIFTISLDRGFRFRGG